MQTYHILQVFHETDKKFRPSHGKIGRQCGLLCGQNFSASCPSSFQNLTTSERFHSFPKTMRSFPPGIVRLKGTLQDLHLPHCGYSDMAYATRLTNIILDNYRNYMSLLKECQAMTAISFIRLLITFCASCGKWRRSVDNYPRFC